MLAAKVQADAALKDLGRLEKHFRFAQAAAMTKVAKFAEADVKRAARDTFDRPTAFTLNSTYTKPATAARPVATVGFKNRWPNPREHHLTAQVHGGGRSLKGFEKLLRAAGVLGVNEYAVPARGFPLDALGNIPRSVVVAILSDLKAMRDDTAWSTPESRAKRAKRRKIAKRAVYFATRPGSHLPLGIYQRVNTGWGSLIRGVFMFVRQPHYRVRLPLQQIVARSIERYMTPVMAEQMRHALATAR